MFLPLRRNIWDDWGTLFPGAPYVTAVTAKSPAAKASIAAHWRLVAVGPTNVATGAGAAVALAAAAAGKLKLHFNNKHGVPSCPACDAPVDDTEHLIQRCPAYAQARNDVFGAVDPPLTVLQSDPWKVVSYLRRVGRLTPEYRRASARAVRAV